MLSDSIIFEYNAKNIFTAEQKAVITTAEKWVGLGGVGFLSSWVLGKLSYSELN